MILKSIDRILRSALLLLVAFFAALPATSRAEVDLVAFTTDRNGNWEVYTMYPDGSNQVRLTFNGAADLWPRWSPDGRKLVFVSDRTGTRELYTMNADGSNQIQLTTNGYHKQHSDWSPNGLKIAFDSARNGGASNVYVVNADGSNETNLTNSDGLEPRWSPDGSKIVFVSWRDGNGEIYTMNSDGSNQTRLTYNGAADWHPVWSPDGAKILWRTDRDGNYEIYSMNADGSSPTRLTTNGAYDADPFWGRDGRIMFRSNRDGNDEIYVMDPDGTDVARLTFTSSAEYEPAWYTPRAQGHTLMLSKLLVIGGVQTSGSVTFDQTAPTQRLVLMSDNSDYVLMSTYCIVPANQTTGTFKIWTYGVVNTTVATISAEFSGVTRTANLTLTPATLDLLWLSPTGVVGGNPSMGNVRLVGKAPVGGALVALATSNPAAANHASSVTISYGASLRQFPISTFGVDTTKNVVISATYRGVTRTASISVRPATLSALTLATNTVKGGNPVTATISMTGKTGPRGRTIALSSSSPKAIVPATMYIPPQKASWPVTVSTVAVTSNTTATISASQGGITRTANLLITP